MQPAPANSHKGQWLNAWHVNPSANRDYDFIDGLRGLALLGVLAGHHFYVNPNAGPATQFIAGVIGAGGYGVTLFFALSGFLISWPFWKLKFNKSEHAVPPGYGWRRFWKIYPPLALSVIVFTPLYIFRNHDWSYVGIAAQWLVGLPALLPVSGKLNPVTWSLVVEIQFYALLPLLFLGLRRASTTASLWVVTLVFLVAPVLMRTLTGYSAAFYPEINSHFPSALDAFYLGILIAALDHLKLLKKSLARLGDLGFVLMFLAALATGWVSLHPEGNSRLREEGLGLMVKIAAGCLLCYVANPGHPRAQLLCAPWLRWCGIVSYECYLFHQPVILTARTVFGPAGGSVPRYAGIIGGSLLFSLVASALIYRYFSLPILKYGRSKHSRPGHG